MCVRERESVCVRVCVRERVCEWKRAGMCEGFRSQERGSKVGHPVVKDAGPAEEQLLQGYTPKVNPTR